MIQTKFEINCAGPHRPISNTGRCLLEIEDSLVNSYNYMLYTLNYCSTALSRKEKETETKEITFFMNPSPLTSLPTAKLRVFARLGG